MTEKFPFTIFFMGIVAGSIFSYYITLQSVTQRPKNCAEYAKAYIDMAREDYKASSEYDSKKWNEIIEIETRIQHMCEDQLGNYPVGKMK